LVVGTEPTSILAGVQEKIERRGGWLNPFGDGDASKRIIDVIIK